MTNRNNEQLLNELILSLDLPDSAYEKAAKRYEDIGEWLGRDDSLCSGFEPHIFPQGSFRLGTAIHPLNGSESYDLDLACSLRREVTAATHSQEALKSIIGQELELYRQARNIKSPLDEKHRCWRLDYADGVSFHMDIVPCIPKDETQRQTLSIAMENYGMDRDLAVSVADMAVGITDDRLPSYKLISPGWLISNPEGYAKWFESKMRSSMQYKVAMEAAQVDDLPIYRFKTPLQRVIQLLKRHRDQMFSLSPDSKPISVIITTLAASSYSGTSNLEVALLEVLNGLKSFSDSGSSQIPNPVNPEENFADRWTMPQYDHLQLKQNFSNWVVNVTRDFGFLLEGNDLDVLTESLNDNFAINPSKDALAKTLGIATVSSTPNVVAAKKIEQPSAKPWHKGI